MNNYCAHIRTVVNERANRILAGMVEMMRALNIILIGSYAIMMASALLPTCEPH